MFKFLKIFEFKFLLEIRNLKLVIAIALLIGFAFIAKPQKAHGQALSLSLWPPLLEVMMQPGRSITQVYKLTNNSDHELSITPQIFPFEPMNEAGEIKINRQPSPAFKPAPAFFSFASAEKLGQPFALAIGQTKEMVLKISLPISQPENDYYFTLLFSTAEESSQTSAGLDKGESTSVAQIGTNILLTVSQLGKPVLLGRIINFSVFPLVDSFSAANFTVVLENWGRNLWKPFGRIVITSPLNPQTEIKLLEQNVLADSSRELTIAPFRPKIPLGPFKASLDFSLNEDGPRLSSEITFWYLPYRLLLVLLAAILLLSIKRLIRRKQSFQ